MFSAIILVTHFVTIFPKNTSESGILRFRYYCLARFMYSTLRLKAYYRELEIW